MKTNAYKFLAVVGLAVLTSTVIAKHGADDPSHHEGEQHDISGHETFHGHFVLLPTNNAPAGARGIAELEQENEDGAVNYKIDVHTSRLPAGTYSVSAVLLSDGSSVTLGDLAAGTEHSAKANLLLPAGVAITDIGQIIVSDGDGLPILIGDVTQTTGSTGATLNANVKLTPGPAAPDVKGRAQKKINRKHGTIKQRFTLSASKLPASTTYNVLVDGVQTATVTSNKKGRLSIRDLNIDLTNVQTVSLVTTTDGTEAATAHF